MLLIYHSTSFKKKTSNELLPQKLVYYNFIFRIIGLSILSIFISMLKLFFFFDINKVIDIGVQPECVFTS